MNINVIKRNGDIVEFNKQKIINAINKAFIEVDGLLYETETAEEIADLIEEKIKFKLTPMSVEDIQNLIEEYLMSSERKDVARAYIRFRYKREVARQTSKTYDSIMELVEMKNDELKEENSNKNATVAST